MDLKTYLREHKNDRQEGDCVCKGKCTFCEESIFAYEEAFVKTGVTLHAECLRDYVNEMEDEALAEKLGFKFFV